MYSGIRTGVLTYSRDRQIFQCQKIHIDGRGKLEMLMFRVAPLTFWKCEMNTVSNFSLFSVAPAVQEVGHCKCVPSTD